MQPTAFTGWRTILQQHLGSPQVEMEEQIMLIAHPVLRKRRSKDSIAQGSMNVLNQDIDIETKTRSSLSWC